MSIITEIVVFIAASLYIANNIINDINFLKNNKEDEE